MASSTSGNSAPRRRALAVSAAIAGIALLYALWPGDVPFVHDESKLLANAFQANRGGELASVGLFGTSGLHYGPLPTWVYQLLLAVGGDLVTVALLHAVLFVLSTGASLWWLGRTLGLPLWFLPLPLLSPYFWSWSRTLWDNPMLLPLGTLAVAAYAAHLRAGRGAPLLVAIGAALAISLVHVMGVPLLATLLLHMLWTRRRELLAQRYAIVGVVFVWGMMSRLYWVDLLRNLPNRRSNMVDEASTVAAWLFPFTGGRLFGPDGFAAVVGPELLEGRWLDVAGAAGWLGQALVWVGIGTAAVIVRRAAQARAFGPRAHAAALALLALGWQILVDGLSGKHGRPHYHNGTWIAFVLFAWLAVEAAQVRGGWWKRAAQAGCGVLAAASLLTIVAVMTRVHDRGGTREVYGPTLQNQIEVARELVHYDPRSHVHYGVWIYRQFPHTLNALRTIHALPPAARPRTNLGVIYATDDERCGRIALTERD